MGLLFKGARRLLQSLHVLPAHSAQRSLDETTQEAASSLLGNQSKIQAGQQAVFLEQLRQIAHEEMKDVQKLKAKRLGGPWQEMGGKGDDMGDLIICDDYRKNDPPPSRVWPWAAAGLGIAAMGIGGWLGKMALEKVAEKALPGAVQRIESGRGFMIDLVPALQEKKP